MIQKFIDRFLKRNYILREMLSAKHPASYKELVTNVIKVIAEREDDPTREDLDVDKLVEIDHGNYQGTLLYLIPDSDSQPDTYYYVKVVYGSCSGCDTLQGIRYDERSDTPTNNQVDQYMTLALHIVQRLKLLD